MTAGKKHLTDCLTVANDLRFRRFIAEEGTAVTELLEQIKKDAEFMSGMDGEWFAALLDESRKTAQKYPTYLKNSVADLPDFSENGLAVLRLQAKGYSISEIPKKIGINARR